MEFQDTGEPSPAYENCKVATNQSFKSIKRTGLGMITIYRRDLSKQGALHRLMYALTMLMQPFGSHDILTIFEIIRPVCFIAGWNTAMAIRPLRNHMSSESGADQYASVVAFREGMMLRGLYCKMVHDTDYPGDFLYDLGYCLAVRVIPRALYLNIGVFHKEMEDRMNFCAHKLGQSRRQTLRVLHFVCLAIKKGDICQTDLTEFSYIFPQKLIAKLTRQQGRLWSFFSNTEKRNYFTARRRSLNMLMDRKIRERVDWLVAEDSVGYLITSLATVKGYNKLTAALAWDSLSRPRKQRKT